MTNTLSKHTPGPWTAAKDNNGRPYVLSDGTIRIADCWYLPIGRRHGGEAEANAQLIAAAPDLLRALIDLGDWLAYGMNKAAGAEPTAEDHAACERVAAQARAAIDKATKL